MYCLNGRIVRVAKYLIKLLTKYLTCQHAVICNKCIGYVRHSMMVCSNPNDTSRAFKMLVMHHLLKVDPVNYWKQDFIQVIIQVLALTLWQ